MAASLNQIYQMLGGLTAKVDGMAKQLEDASDSRSAMHQQLADLTMRTTHLEKDVLAVKNSVGQVQRVTDEVTEWKQRGIGALAVVGFAGAALGGTAVWFFGRIVAFVKTL